MADRRSRDIKKIIRLQSKARARYVYFILTDVENATAFWWELLGPNDETIATGPVFRTKALCLKSLRANQQHASTHEIRDAH